MASIIAQRVGFNSVTNLIGLYRNAELLSSTHPPVFTERLHIIATITRFISDETSTADQAHHKM